MALLNRGVQATCSHKWESHNAQQHASDDKCAQLAELTLKDTRKKRRSSELNVLRAEQLAASVKRLQTAGAGTGTADFATTNTATAGAAVSPAIAANNASTTAEQKEIEQLMEKIPQLRDQYRLVSRIGSGE